MKLEQNDGSLSLAGIINFLQCAGINTDLQEYMCSIKKGYFRATCNAYGEQKSIHITSNLKDLVRVSFYQKNFYRQPLKTDPTFNDYKEIWFSEQEITEYSYKGKEVIIAKAKKKASGINNTSLVDCGGTYIECDSVEEMQRLGNVESQISQVPLSKELELNDKLMTHEEASQQENDRLKQTYAYWKNTRGWKYNHEWNHDMKKSPYQKVKTRHTK